MLMGHSLSSLQASGDIHAVAHEAAVRFLDHVADLNADMELYPPVLGRLGVALDQARFAPRS
jgi:hypothetical protein